MSIKQVCVNEKYTCHDITGVDKRRVCLETFNTILEVIGIWLEVVGSWNGSLNFILERLAIVTKTSLKLHV